MSYIIAGLGNPGDEYTFTRHNTGRIMIEHFREAHDFPEWKSEKKYKALVSKEKIGKESVMLVEPDDFMNNSGKSVAPMVASKKAPSSAKATAGKAEKVIVIYDDIDLPFGVIKVSFDRGSGGHKGLESVINSLKTREFVRIRIGISPSDAKGRAKKPKGEEKVLKFLLGTFKKEELNELKKVSKKVSGAIEMIIAEGREKAMGEYNR